MRFTKLKRVWLGLTLALCLVSSLVWAASRFTDLTALTTAASGDFIPIVDISDTTDDAAGSSRKITLTNLATFFWTAPSLTAGSTTAGSWPKLASGTVLTTAEAGAVEYDGNAIYGTTDAGNRGYVPIKNCIRADATRTLPNDLNENAIFNSPTNGRLTLETGAYLFDGLINVTTMSATTGNASIDILGAGTATAAAWLWHVVGVDGATATAATQTGSTVVTQQSPASALTGGTGTAMTAGIRGTMEITVAGTVIPSIDQVTAAAAVVAIGSYLCFERIGSTTAVSIGQWD